MFNPDIHSHEQVFDATFLLTVTAHALFAYVLSLYLSNFYLLASSKHTTHNFSHHCQIELDFGPISKLTSLKNNSADFKLYFLDIILVSFEN